MALLEGSVERGGFQFFCPGCKTEHWVRVASERWVGGTRPIWTWNGSLEAPTFNPSVLHFDTLEGGGRRTRCHYFVRDGLIDYCGDCPHEFNGKLVRMIDLEAADKGQYEVEIVERGQAQVPAAVQAMLAKAGVDRNRPAPEAQGGARALAPAPPPAPRPPPGPGQRLWSPRPKAKPPQTVARFPHPRR